MCRRIGTLLVFPVLLGALACGAALDERGGDGPPLMECSADGDCPSGLVCRAHVCVADDGVPPEKPDPRTFLPPASTARRVFALSPDGNTVSVIDPARVSVRSIPLPAEPLSLAVVAGEEAVAVLSRAGAALSLLSFVDDEPRLSIARLPRRASAITLAPDASWAVAWTPDGAPLDAGTEGIVLLIDVVGLRSGGPAKVVERVAGRRHTDVFFRAEGGAARDAVVVGKEEIAIFDLATPEAPSPVRVELPPAFAEIATRRVASTEDGAFVLLASLASSDLAVLDVGARALRSLPLPGAPADLAVAPGLAVLTLREASRAAWLPLPGALDDPSAIRVADVSLPGAVCEVPGCRVAPGQVRLSPDASFALLFTTSQPSESFGRLDLGTGAWTVFDKLRKDVRTVAIAPSGSHAIVLHARRPDSTDADPFEREVDRAEGYSTVALADGGATQLVLTGDIVPVDVVFALGTRWAGVTLRGDTAHAYRVDSVDLETLVSAPLPLSSAPEWAGPLAAPFDGWMWVTQRHPAGRIGFVDLAARTSRTITGYELNGEIE